MEPPHAPRNLTAVLAALQRGRPEPVRVEAWTELVTWIQEAALARLLRRIRARAGAGLEPEAVLQELYIALYDYPPSGPEDLRLEFRVLDACRKLRRERAGAGVSGRARGAPPPLAFGPDTPEPPTPGATPEERALALAGLEEVRQVLASLEDAGRREVARLRYLEGLSLEAIAARTGTSLGAVKSALSREIAPALRRKLRECRWKDLRHDA